MAMVIAPPVISGVLHSGMATSFPIPFSCLPLPHTASPAIAGWRHGTVQEGERTGWVCHCGSVCLVVRLYCFLPWAIVWKVFGVGPWVRWHAHHVGGGLPCVVASLLRVRAVSVFPAPLRATIAIPRRLSRFAFHAMVCRGEGGRRGRRRQQGRMVSLRFLLVRPRSGRLRDQRLPYTSRQPRNTRVPAIHHQRR